MRQSGVFTDGEDRILDRMLAEQILSALSEEEAEILRLWLLQEYSFSEIGKVVGMKYRGKALTGSTIRYHKDRIVAKLREQFDLS